MITATTANRKWVEAIRTKATTKVIIEITTVGANDRNICTERMSEFAREMILAGNGSDDVLTIATQTEGSSSDDNVEWDGVRHDSRSLVYRTPGGAVPAHAGEHDGQCDHDRAYRHCFWLLRGKIVSGSGIPGFERSEPLNS